MMKAYFEKKIGEKIKQPIVTGETFFTKVYERVYTIEILAVQKDELVVEVTSYDKVPSGYGVSGTDKRYGERTITIGKKSKTDIVFEIIQSCDRSFLNEYKIKAI